MHRFKAGGWAGRVAWLTALAMSMLAAGPGGSALSRVQSGNAPETPPATIPGSGAESAPKDSSGQNEYYVLETRHQVFAEFRQVDTVRVNQRFPIGEGEEMGEVILFNPHLSITEKGKILQLSDTLYNPAVRVRVMAGDSLVQESWAFYFTSAPHFRRSDMFGFRLLDFHVSDRFIKVAGPKPFQPSAKTDSAATSH